VCFVLLGLDGTGQTVVSWPVFWDWVSVPADLGVTSSDRTITEITVVVQVTVWNINKGEASWTASQGAVVTLEAIVTDTLVLWTAFAVARTGVCTFSIDLGEQASQSSNSEVLHFEWDI
jgi:hypothetical protein